MRIYQYSTEEEKQQIVENQSLEGYILVNISNITEGDFLGFVKDGTMAEQRLEQIELSTAYTQLQIDYLAFSAELKGGE